MLQLQLIYMHLKAFIRTEMKEIIIQSDLQSYSRTQSVAKMAHIHLCPLVLMKEIINHKEPQWKIQYLPPGYNQGSHAAITSVQRLIWDLLKYEKQSLTKLVSHKIFQLHVSDHLHSYVHQLLAGLEPSKKTVPIMNLQMTMTTVSLVILVHVFWWQLTCP
jgi:hypothetical protein